MDITNTALVGTTEMNNFIALLALDLELDGDLEGAERLREDYAEARLLRRTLGA